MFHLRSSSSSLLFSRNIFKNLSSFFHSSSICKGKLEDHDIFGNIQADIFFSGYNEIGFQIEGCDVFYSMFLLPYTTFLWNVSSIEEVKPEHFSILEVIEPIDLLLIGTGKTLKPLPKEIYDYCDKIKCDLIEVQSTQAAIGTFNILNQEGRNFACGIIPIDVENGMLKKEPGKHVKRSSD